VTTISSTSLAPAALVCAKAEVAMAVDRNVAPSKIALIRTDFFWIEEFIVPSPSYVLDRHLLLFARTRIDRL
jgi:hypothetical protein